MHKFYLERKETLHILALHLSVICLTCLLIFIEFPCPFKFVFRIPCPACGTLHALRAIIKLDFEGYVRHNYLAIPMVMAVWLGIHKRKLLCNSKIIDFFIYIVCILDIIRYFSKLFVDFL